VSCEVVSLSLPAGKYVFTVTSGAHNEDSSPQGFTCTIYVGQTGLNPVGSLYIPGHSSLPLTLVSVATVASATTVSVRCGGFQQTPLPSTLSAVLVTNLIQQ